MSSFRRRGHIGGRSVAKAEIIIALCAALAFLLLLT